MTPVFRVVKPGVLTTIQDLGRPNAVPSGVTAGGAMDRFAHSAANLLVGNDRSAATLECTVIGPTLAAELACTVAITGGDLSPRVDREEVPMWTAIRLRSGDTLSLSARRSGARAYVAIAGGVIGDRWLGSMSTDLLCGRGGMHGRPLAADDVITAGVTLVDEAGRTLPPALRPDYTAPELRVIPGPHFGRLDDESRDAFLKAPFTVGHDSNRMGYRLAGPNLAAPGPELLSFGVFAGVVQLPAGGRPILLMADHQTAGGYPVIAAVASAWIPRAAQLAPGDVLRFAGTSVEDALRARTAQREALELLNS